MDGLAPDERRAIEYLALGEPLRLEEIEALAGADAVAGAESHGLVTVERIEAVRLAHPLYGEVLRASMPVLRAVAARRELARLVSERPDRDLDDALRIARWLLDAGEPIPQPLLLTAARAASLAGDAELGARLATLALDGGAGWDGGAAARPRARGAGPQRGGRGGARRDRGRRRRPRGGDRVLEQRTAVLYWGLERMDDALALLDRARAWWPGPGLAAAARAAAAAAPLAPGRPGRHARGHDVDPRRPASGAGGAPADRARPRHQPLHSGRVREARELLVDRLPPIPLRDENDELACIMWCVLGLEIGLGHRGRGGVDGPGAGGRARGRPTTARPASPP